LGALFQIGRLSEVANTALNALLKNFSVQAVIASHVNLLGDQNFQHSYNGDREKFNGGQSFEKVY